MALSSFGTYGKYFSLGIILCLIGCAPSYYWGKAGASRQDWESDVTECRVLAARYVPVDRQHVQMTPGYQIPSTSSCNYVGGGSFSCSTTGGEYVPPTGYSYDGNEDLRSQAVEACLYRRGWQKVPINESQRRLSGYGTDSKLPPRENRKLGDRCENGIQCEGSLICRGGYCSRLQ